MNMGQLASKNVYQVVMFMLIIIIKSVGYMLNIRSLLLLTLLLITLSNCQSIILKTQDYPFPAPKLPGVNYPQHLQIVQSSNLTLTLSIYNLTSLQQVHDPITFNKTFPSTCQFALETVDYGYYTKFPFYRIVGECGNQTHTQGYNLKIYRSGDFGVERGVVVGKTGDQLGCQLGPIRVQYFYSSIGIADTFVYRFCTKKQPGSQSLYKQFTADGKNPYIFKQQSIQKIVGLTNISLYDMQPAIGIDGKYNVYLSQTYGIIINGGSKYLQTTWKPTQKILKVQKLCWSNNLAVLTQGYIYFLGTTIYPNQSVAITVTRKTDKINIQSTSKCGFFVIGHFAVCSIYNQTTDETTWYIYGEDTTKIRTNATEVFKQKVVPYIAQDLCSTNSFYMKYSRYQLYFPPKISTPTPSPSPSLTQPTLRSLPLPKQAQGNKYFGFIDVGNLFIAGLGSVNATHQNLYFFGVDKTRFNNSIFGTTTVVSINATNFKLDYLYTYATVFYVDKINNQSKSTVIFTRNYGQTSPFFIFANKTIIDIAFTELGYFRPSDANINNYQLILKTPLETNTFGRYNFGTGQLRYPYQFQASSFKICSLTSFDNQILLYRVDYNKNLVVMRAGLRNGNYLVLDDVRTFSEYKFYEVECSHYGLFLYSKDINRIVVLNPDLQVMVNLQVEFEEIKFTRTLILVKNGAFVEVRSQINGDLIGINKWEMGDLLTNMHSVGFINTKLWTYYEYVNSHDSDAKESTQTKSLKQTHMNLQVQ